MSESIELTRNIPATVQDIFAVASKFNSSASPFLEAGLREEGVSSSLFLFTALSAIIFSGLFFLQWPFSYAFSSTFRTLSWDDKMSWSSYILSMIHAPTSALLASICLVEGYIDVGVGEQLFTYVTDLQVIVLSWTLGYMIVDQCIILAFPKAFKDWTALVIHHFIVFSSYTLGATYSPPTGTYLFLAYQVQEWVNPCLTMRWFLEKMDMKESTAYLINGLSLFVLWFVIRIVFGTYVCYFSVAYLPEEAWSKPALVLTLTLGCIFQSLQYYWGYKILKGVVRALKKLLSGGDEGKPKLD